MNHISPQVVNFQAIVIATALDLYAKTHIQVNRMYTPSAMLRTASRLTQIHFKRGQYSEAAKALRFFAKEGKSI